MLQTFYKKQESYMKEKEHTGVWTVSNSGRTYVTNIKSTHDFLCFMRAPNAYLEVHVLPSSVKLKSFLVLFPSLNVNSTNSAADAIADVTVVVANSQQFKFFCSRPNQYKVPLAAEKLHKEGGRNRVCWGSFEINQARLMLHLLNKRQSWGTSFWTSPRGKLFCLGSNKYCIGA